MTALISTNVHNVNSIRVTQPRYVGGSYTADIVFSCADGTCYEVTAFADEPSSLAVFETQTEYVP